MNLDELTRRLDLVSTGLNSDGAINYVASFGVFRAPAAGHLSANAILAAAVGANAVIGRTSPCTAAEVVASVAAAIHHAGEAGSHPNLGYLQTQAFALEATAILQHVEAWASSAELLSSLWLKDGHPFYPVFWDFAFLAVHGSDAVVLIGASSD